MFRAVILGAPASGKGTISAKIVNFFEMVHLSSGNILRNEIKNKSQVGIKIEQYVTHGKLVPDDVMTDLTFNHIDKLGSSSFLLDGFPRTRQQAQHLVDRYPIQLAIVLDVPIEEIIDRVKGRWVHVPSGRVYNESFDRPAVWGKDDITGESLEQRPDDAPDAVRLRLGLYDKAITPLLNFYKELGILQRFAGRTSDEIWPQVRDALIEKQVTQRENPELHNRTQELTKI